MKVFPKGSLGQGIEKHGRYGYIVDDLVGSPGIGGLNHSPDLEQVSEKDDAEDRDDGVCENFQHVG